MKTKPFVCLPVHIVESNLSTGALKTLLGLLSYRNSETGKCNPGPDKLRERLGGVARRTMFRWLQELRQAGILEAHRREGAAFYTLHMDVVPPASSAKNGTELTPSSVPKMALNCAKNGTEHFPHPYMNQMIELETPIVPLPTAAPAVAQPAVERVADPPLQEASAPPLAAAVATRPVQAALWETEPAKVVEIGRPIPKPGPDPTWFPQWWAIYWRKVSRKDAEKAFKKHVKTQERFDQVMAATRAQTPMMMAREAEHRPHGATWLNAERWEDLPAPPVRKPPDKQSLVERTKALWAQRIARGERPI